MKTFNILAAITLGLISTAAAQTQCDSVASAVPSCGQECLLSAGSAIGCSTGDYRCQCSSSDALVSTALGCVLNACGFESALAVQTSASAICDCVATATGVAPVVKKTAAPGARARRW
ncbi:hypothetical protein GQ43DRAFT_51998 [Delitschia confertaspora ATCC 74209]|uniref:CFEM domain-containing protein n=1 Tax=Delitschia confertaspora ATCC 74209 TaxID=1513339 RepID=A0A9P4N2X1_9PLEO|nr:hypothetical protein GQ43DRAFT_51998 [Delitschia confertaspora ATCC 74209]